MTQLQVKKEIINNLKGLKVTLGLTTYNDVIEELIRLAYSKEKMEGITNEELLENHNKTQKHLVKRLEALHTRIGYYEKDYFLKIQDIFDAVDDYKKPSTTKNEIKNEIKEVRENVNIDEKKYRKQIEDLQESHSEIEEVNQKLNSKINLLSSKFIKKSGVFAQGYECNLSEEEYNKIFS